MHDLIIIFISICSTYSPAMRAEPADICRHYTSTPTNLCFDISELEPETDALLLQIAPPISIAKTACATRNQAQPICKYTWPTHTGVAGRG